MQYIAQGLLIELSSINHMTHVGLLCFIVGLVTGFSSIDHLTQIQRDSRRWTQFHKSIFQN